MADSALFKTTIPNEKPDKRVFAGKEKVRIAAVQAPQIVFNKEKSIDIAIQKIKEASENGAELVAFSESYLPCYAAYYASGFACNVDEMMQWNLGLVDNSIVIPSHDTDRIAEACKMYHVYCVMGVNELDDANGVRTFYNTQIFFGNDGTILGRHRKTKPTYTERVYWGDGDGSDLNVYKTSIGRIGGLVCAEHHTIAVSRAQMMMGEEIHIANYPGFWTNTGSFRPLEPNQTELGEGCDGVHAIKEYAFQGNCFAVSVHGLLREQDFEPEYRNLIDSKDMNFAWATGGSFIVNPFGEFMVKPCVGQDTILYADCEAKLIKARANFYDFMGHYSRPDVAHIELNHTHPRNLVVNGAENLYVPEYQKIKEISERYEVALSQLEKFAAKIDNSK